ncbi:MAG: hypothetical protein K1Y01_14695, partial [Vicinamibacteria bacterium]|nr:hypothetical protein [Vicinamibacteria bacterium]
WDGRYSVAPDRFNDLGTATLVSLWTHATGRQATAATLGSINLVYIVAGSVLLVFALPGPLRLGLVPIFLLVELVAPRYRSMDTVAIHGSLAAMALAVPLLTARAPRPWMAIAWGILLFGIHKTRSVYGTYAVLALLPILLVGWARFRDRGLLMRAGFLLLGFTLCEIPWRIAVHGRLNDPRLVEKDALPEHATYAALISGIGWTENPWGIKPWDPWVAQFLADMARGPVVRISTHESERRSKAVFLSLAKQRPADLAWLYIRRIPTALGEYSIFGAAGACLWIAAALLALGLAWARGDSEGIVLVLSPLGLATCLVLQTIVIDTRYIYAHPLELVSAMVLAVAVPVAFRNARPPEPRTNPGGTV